MQINNTFNNTSTASLFSEFQRINEEQRANRNHAEAEQQNSSTISTTSWRGITAFQDANIRISLADRSDPNSNRDNRSLYVTITCLHTFHSTRILDRELADKLYNNFMQMADNDELNCTIEDFSDARKNMLKMLIFEWLLAMLYGVSDEQSTTQGTTVTDNQIINKMVADDVINSEMKDLITEFLEENGLQATCRELLDNIVDMASLSNLQVKPDIPMLSEEELSQIEPDLAGTINGTATKAYANNLWANLED